jgi:hypothetical protein
VVQVSVRSGRRRSSCHLPFKYSSFLPGKEVEKIPARDLVNKGAEAVALKS